MFRPRPIGKARAGPGSVESGPEGARISRFDAQDAGVTFLAYFLLGPGEEPELSFPAG
jgi:hypothetical protein